MSNRWTQPPQNAGTPDFANLLSVLDKKKPSRPTLFEFFRNGPIDTRLAGSPPASDSALDGIRFVIAAFAAAGYDYTTLTAGSINAISFPAGEREHGASVSMNEGSVITDRASFDAYPWPDPEHGEYALLDDTAGSLPGKMKFIVSGPCGVLENAMSLVGYEGLCMMTIDDEQLALDVFEAIGSRLVRFYELALQYDSVGAVIGNDDWGFKSQTMLAPDDMRRFVFPWHQKIVEAAHAAGKPAILHSCGCLTEVMDDIVDDMKYDGKHSYEDTIQPVEDAYDQYHSRIAIMGGMDLDFVCRSTPQQVYDRSRAMLQHAEKDGAYALGTGNSVPEYVPDENYFAMIDAALTDR